MTVVTRFAPSPSGHLHVGGARTALFCWAFAKGGPRQAPTPRGPGPPRDRHLPRLHGAAGLA